MSSVVQRENPLSKRGRREAKYRNSNRGRPRKVIPPRPPLVHKKRQWAHFTGDSLTTVTRKIKRGEIRTLPSEGPGKPLKIPTSEYLRLGYVRSLDELI